MKKRCAAVLLIFCLALALAAPAAAAEFERPAESDFWHELTAADARTLVNAVAQKTQEQNVVMVFYSTQCLYCQNFVPLFARYAQETGTSIQAVSGLGTGVMADLSPLSQNGMIPSSIGWPIVLVYDAQRGGYAVEDSVRDMETFESLVRRAAVNRPSGETGREKLSPAGLVQLLEDAPNAMPQGEVFDQLPSCAAPYAPGKVGDRFLQAAADRLNALRAMAGLPAAALDATLCENAQYGAVILAHLGGLSHTPAQPADMDDDFYQRAYSATSHSNIYAGRELTLTPDGFMDDSDLSNIDRVGHRRWQLNPRLGKVGFGYAEASGTRYRRYTDEWVFDQSASASYDYIAWPASGHFPVSDTYFSPTTAWSVTLNPSLYAAPAQSQVRVTLTRASDGREWVFSGSYQPSEYDDYFRVDNGGYGVNNCIIFRPGGVDRYQGVYTVSIDGLETRQGEAVEDFCYTVEFFDPASPTGHVFDDGVVTQAPTRNRGGVLTHACTVCGATEEEPLPRLGTLGVKEVSGSAVTLYDPSGLLGKSGDLAIFAASYDGSGRMVRLLQSQAPRRERTGEYSLAFDCPPDAGSRLFFLSEPAGAPLCPALTLPSPTP